VKYFLQRDVRWQEPIPVKKENVVNREKRRNLMTRSFSRAGFPVVEIWNKTRKIADEMINLAGSPRKKATFCSAEKELTP
jgi:hypothetical protein